MKKRDDPNLPEWTFKPEDFDPALLAKSAFLAAQIANKRLKTLRHENELLRSDLDYFKTSLLEHQNKMVMRMKFDSESG